jgi:23S rRNA (uracil1939-C5)-methyltransferase
MQPAQVTFDLEVTGFDNEARGVARHDGKVVFVDGALIGERVVARQTRSRPSYLVAELEEVLKASVLRMTPRCVNFGVCGGCSMQHLGAAAQVAAKQRQLEDSFWHIAKLRPELILRPIHGPSWRYRYRARLAVRHVVKKGAVLVGFHEKRSSFVADMKNCEVLPEHVSKLLPALRELVASLSIRDRLPQFELAVGELATVLVARVLEPPSADDEQLLRAFADRHQIHFWLQAKGPDTATPFYPADSTLSYRLPEFAIDMPFLPTDFTQVNHQINRVLVGRALRLLQIGPAERVADLFCGLGNFTLPIATQAKQVVGFEGSATLTRRATENAARNGLAERTRFETLDLFKLSDLQKSSLQGFDKMLIDPPREGALEVVRAIAADGFAQPERIVYVSCNPSSLARDAAILVREGGYRLRSAGVVNMFPHTSHVESIAVFERDLKARAAIREAALAAAATLQSLPIEGQ